jgi:hypothetical protein
MDPSLAVIILNYRRPQNIGRIAAAAREALPEAAIFILDQAETDDLRARDDVAWGEVWLRRAAVNKGAGARVPLAASLPFEHFLAIDDDTFLTPRQIAALVERFRAEPDRAHGIFGQRIEVVDGTISLRNELSRIDAALSMLNQVYVFSRRQAQAAIALSARLGFASWDAVGPTDDILLSCAADKPPLCHELGPIAVCPSWNRPGVAVWRSGGFMDARWDVLGRLLRAKAIAAFSPLTIRPAPSTP